MFWLLCCSFVYGWLLVVQFGFCWVDVVREVAVLGVLMPLVLVFVRLCFGVVAVLLGFSFWVLVGFVNFV